MRCLEISATHSTTMIFKGYSLKWGSRAAVGSPPGCLEQSGRGTLSHSQSYRSGDQLVKMESTLKSGAPPSRHPRTGQSSITILSPLLWPSRLGMSWDTTNLPLTGVSCDLSMRLMRGENFSWDTTITINQVHHLNLTSGKESFIVPINILSMSLQVRNLVYDLAASFVNSL